MKLIGKKLPLAIAIALALVLACGGLYAYGQQYYERNYSWYDGSGSYVLEDAGDLEAFARLVNGTWVDDEAATSGTTAMSAALRAQLQAEDGAAHSFEDETVRLQGDIHYTALNIYYAYGHTPIGTAEHPFQGTFDGGNRAISRLLFSNTDADAPSPTSYVGLFGHVGQYGTIKNVNVKDTCAVRINVSDSATPVRYVGSVAGWCEGAIRDCTSAADIQVIWDDGKAGADRPAEVAAVVDGVGGIAGYCDGDLSGDTFKGHLEVTTPADAYYIAQDDAHAVNVVKYVGGIVGRSGGAPERAGVATRTYGAVTNCTNSANLNIVTSGAGGRDRFGEVVDSKSQYVGGIAGYAIDDVSNCKNTGGIAATSYVVDFDKSDEENEKGLDQADGGGDAVGGIVGGWRSEGSGGAKPTEEEVERSKAFRDVNGIAVDRGIVGMQENGNPDQIYLTNCSNSGRVEACNNVGGIVGEAGTYTNIVSCINGDAKKALADEAYARVYSTRWNKPKTGGIAGSSYGRVSYCRNHGEVANTKVGYYVGGIVGDLYYYRDANLNKYDVPELWGCYNTGVCASGMLRRGTIAGGSGGYIHDCLFLYGLTGGEDEEERTGQVAIGYEGSGDGAVHANMHVAYASDTATASAIAAGESDALCLKSSEAIAWLNANAQREGWKHYWMLASNVNRGYPVLKEEGYDAVAELDVSGLSPKATLEKNATYTAAANPVPQVKLSVTIAGKEQALVQNADYYVVPDPAALGANGVCKGVTSGKPYTAHVQGIGNYTGTCCDVAYGIDKGDFGECSIVIPQARYSGKAQNPGEIYVVDASGLLVEPSAYTYTINAGEDCVDPGTYAVTAKANSDSNYRGSCMGDYVIAKIDIAKDCDVIGVTYTDPIENVPRVWFYDDVVYKLYEVNPIYDDAGKLTYYTLDDLKSLRDKNRWYGITDSLLEAYVGYPKVEGFEVQMRYNDLGARPLTFATAKSYDKNGDRVYGMAVDYTATRIKPSVIGVNYELGRLDDDWWRVVYGADSRNVESFMKGSIAVAYSSALFGNSFTTNYDALSFTVNPVSLRKNDLEITQTTTVLKYNDGMLPENLPTVKMKYRGNVVDPCNYSFKLDHTVDINGNVREGNAMTFDIGTALYYRLHFHDTASIICDDIDIHVTIVEDQKPIDDPSIVVMWDPDWNDTYTFAGIENRGLELYDTEKDVKLREGIDYELWYNSYAQFASPVVDGKRMLNNSPGVSIRGMDAYIGYREEVYDVKKTVLDAKTIEAIGRGEVDGVSLRYRYTTPMYVDIEKAGPNFPYRVQGWNTEELSEYLGLTWKLSDSSNAVAEGRDVEVDGSLGGGNSAPGAGKLFVVTSIEDSAGTTVQRAVEPGTYCLTVRGTAAGNCGFVFADGTARVPISIIPIQLTTGYYFADDKGRERIKPADQSVVYLPNHDNDPYWTLGNTDECIYTGNPIEPKAMIFDGRFADSAYRDYLFADAKDGGALYKQHLLNREDYQVLTAGFEEADGPTETGTYYVSKIAGSLEGEHVVGEYSYPSTMNKPGSRSEYRIVPANLSVFEVATPESDLTEGAWIKVGEAFYGNEGAKPSVTFYVDGQECAYVEGGDYRLDYANDADMKSGTVRIMVLDEGHLTADERDADSNPYVEVPFDIISDKVNLANTDVTSWTLPSQVALADAEAGSLVDIPATATYVSSANATVTVPVDAYTIAVGAYDQSSKQFTAKQDGWKPGDDVWFQVEATGKYEQFYAEGEGADGNLNLAVPGSAVSASKPATVVGKATVAEGKTLATANQDGSPITVALSTDRMSYSGAEGMPEVTVKDGGTTLVEGRDYKLKRSAGTSVGAASVTVFGMGSYAGTCELPFVVEPLALASCDVSIDAMIYTGYALKPPKDSIHVSVGGVELSQSDWNVTYSDASVNAGAGAGSLTLAAASGNLVGSVECTFDILGMPIAPERFTATVADKEFTGENVSIGAEDVTVTDAEAHKDLMFGVDYTIGYAGDHRSVGTAEALVIGKGNYAGSMGASFKIMGSDLSGAEVKVLGGSGRNEDTFEFTGKAITPDLRVTLEGVELEVDDDYKASYVNNVDKGTATVVVTGQGNTTGKASATFEIGANDISRCTVSQKTSDYAYTGQGVEPSIVLRLNGTRVAAKEYTLTYFDAEDKQLDAPPVEIGSYQVEIDGTGDNLDGYTMASFSIVQAPIGECQVTFDGAWYDFGAPVKPDVHLATSAGVSLASDEFEVIYGQASELNATGWVILNAASKHLAGTTIKTFVIGRIPIAANNVTFAGGGTYTYTGSEIKPVPAIVVGERVLKEGADFNVEYLGDCVSVGTQPVEITCPATSVFTSTTTASYEIVEPQDDGGDSPAPEPKSDSSSASQTKAKKANPMTVKAKTLKAKKSKKMTFKAKKAFKISNAKGAVTYKVTKYDKKAKKKIKVSKVGKVTVKKGLKKRTYKLKVSISASGDAVYGPIMKTVTLKVKVR